MEPNWNEHFFENSEMAYFPYVRKSYSSAQRLPDAGKLAFNPKHYFCSTPDKWLLLDYFRFTIRIVWWRVAWLKVKAASIFCQHKPRWFLSSSCHSPRMWGKSWGYGASELNTGIVRLRNSATFLVPTPSCVRTIPCSYLWLATAFFNSFESRNWPSNI